MYNRIPHLVQDIKREKKVNDGIKYNTIHAKSQEDK